MLPAVPVLPDLHANSHASDKQPDRENMAASRTDAGHSPGLGQQDGVLVRRRGLWKVAEDGEPVLQEVRAVVREQNVQCLHVALLVKADPAVRS